MSTAPFLIVAVLIAIDIFCAATSNLKSSEITHFSNSSNFNPKHPSTQQNTQNRPLWGPTNQKSTTTTPWPILGGNKNPPTPQTNTKNSWSKPLNKTSLVQTRIQHYENIQNENRNNVQQNTKKSSSGSQINSNDNTNKPNINAPISGVVDDDNELREFSEILLNKDVNNAAKYVTINYQGKTTSRSLNDEAPQPLLKINQEAFKIPSIQKLILLYDNYILEHNVNEHYTGQEKIEETNLLETILSTPVMQYTRNFLIQKGKLGKDPKEFKDLLRQIWFNMYSRGNGKIGSSGFEHVFLSELKNNQVSGLHNWIYFNSQESRNQANYLGYMKKLDLGNKGAILKYHFTFHGLDKPVGGMFIGTSPELELALYSTCFILRPDQVCPLKLNGNRFIIRTFTYRYRGKNMVGSAFPEI